MTDRPTSAVCPFDALLDSRILGDLSEEDKKRLDEHLAAGCPTCSPRSKEEEQLLGFIHGAMSPLADEAESRRGPVLDKLKDKLAREDHLRRDRRRRRVAMNTFLFLIIALGVTLLSVEYLMYAAERRKLVRAQLNATRAEVAAITSALAHLGMERGDDALPRDPRALYGALLEHRRATDRPYFAPEGSRIDPEGYLLDPFGRRYVYRYLGSKLRFYSTGPNGADEDGFGDDVGSGLIVIPK